MLVNVTTENSKITFSEIGNGEREIINEMEPDDDNVISDESKTSHLTSQNDSSFMFERQEDRIPDIFSIQDDDKQELESVKNEIELIEVNNEEVTA